MGQKPELHVLSEDNSKNARSGHPVPHSLDNFKSRFQEQVSRLQNETMEQLQVIEKSRNDVIETPKKKSNDTLEKHAQVTLKNSSVEFV